jgi:hypothetical protein
MSEFTEELEELEELDLELVILFSISTKVSTEELISTLSPSAYDLAVARASELLSCENDIWSANAPLLSNIKKPSTTLPCSDRDSCIVSTPLPLIAIEASP